MTESFKSFVEAFEIDWNNYKSDHIHDEGEDQSRAGHMIDFLIYLNSSWNFQAHMSEVNDSMEYDTGE